jgi:hypothetical protein
VISARVGLVARLSCAYFASVFSIGFVLGVARALWIAPWLGERAAELAEMPVMVGVSYLAARALMPPGRALGSRGAALVGGAALALLMCAELAVVFFVRGQRLDDYVASRDPVSGSAYALALLLFAAMPAIVARTKG